MELESQLWESEERLEREQQRRMEAERRERDLTEAQLQSQCEIQTLTQEMEGLFLARQDRVLQIVYGHVS